MSSEISCDIFLHEFAANSMRTSEVLIELELVESFLLIASGAQDGVLKTVC